MPMYHYTWAFIHRNKHKTVEANETVTVELGGHNTTRFFCKNQRTAVILIKRNEKLARFLIELYFCVITHSFNSCKTLTRKCKPFSEFSNRFFRTRCQKGSFFFTDKATSRTYFSNIQFDDRNNKYTQFNLMTECNGKLWYSNINRFCNFDMFRNFVKNSNPMCDVALSM